MSAAPPTPGAGSGPDPASPDAGPSQAAPVIGVVSGSPTAEELAALVAVLSAVADTGVEEAPSGRRSAWADPSWQLVGPWPTPGGWRASGLPR